MLVVPTCLEYAKSLLVAGMDETVTAYLDFMQQQDNSTVDTQFSYAQNALANFVTELKRVRKCAPDCGVPTQAPTATLTPQVPSTKP